MPGPSYNTNVSKLFSKKLGGFAPTMVPEMLSTNSSDVQKVISLNSFHILIRSFFVCLFFNPNITVYGKFLHSYMFIGRYNFYFKPSIHQAA